MIRQLGFAAALAAGALLLVASIFVLNINRAFACEQVVASWYGLESCHPGRPCRTAAGVPFNGQQWLVAHRTLPLGTRLRLIYGNRSVTVPVLDRGPYIAGRSVDLSEAVARALGTRAAGTAKICMEVQ